MKSLLDWLCPLKLKTQEKILRNSDYSLTIKRNEELSIEGWTYLVKRRANFRCEDCSSKENLISHHIIHRPEGKNTLRNGKCLCSKHHGDAHKILIPTADKRFLGNFLLQACGKKKFIKLVSDTREEIATFIKNRDSDKRKQIELEGRVFALREKLSLMVKDKIRKLRSEVTNSIREENK